MSRLTERSKDDRNKALCCINAECAIQCGECKHMDKMMEKLAAYEDKEEQGLLLEIPAPIGSVMYEISIGEVQAVSITGYEIDANGIWVCFTQSEYGTDCTANLQIIELFKTRSEAEEALTKIGGKHE